MAYKEIRPPKWANSFLAWYCAPDLLDEIQGDLHEAFYKRCNRKGIHYARLFFILDVFRSISYKTVKNPFSEVSAPMLGNAFAFAMRKLIRRKSFAMINIAGLSAGLAGAFLIYLFVTHELSFDKFHEKGDRIYRMYCAYAEPATGIRSFPYTPPILAPTAKQQVEGIEQIARVVSFGTPVLIRHEEKAFNEKQVYRVDDGFFSIFTSKFLAGDPKTALKQPSSIVLSRSTALKYFGTVDQALGKTLDVDVDGKEIYKVTGVAEDFPSNSHFHFNVLLSVDVAHEKFHPDNWLAHDPVTYVLLPEHVSPVLVETRIRNMTEKILDPVYERRYGKSYATHKEEGGLQEYRLQPLSRVHLYSSDMGEQGNILYIFLFVGVGVMLIGIASFNYINLSTAHSSWEAKGAGIRKVLGATHKQVRNLFLVESISVAIVSSIVAVIIAQAVLISDLTVIHVFIPFYVLPWKACLVLVLIAILAGLLSGFVPARLVNAFDPGKVIKGQLIHGKGGRLRQVLVVGQFVGSMVLIMCTMLIVQQMDYMQDKSLGFNKENLVVIRQVDKLSEKQKNILKQTLSNESFVTSASLCYNDIGEPHNNAAFTPVELIEQGRQDLTVGIPVYIGDRDYLNTLGVNLVYGRPFPEDLPKENQQIILNREALRQVGWQDRKEKDLIGKMIDVNGLRYELAGVVEDYHFLSLRQKIGPMAIMSHYYQTYESLLLRIRPGTQKQAIQRIGTHWKQLNPDVPFGYSFVDQDLQHLYGAEQNIKILFESFAGLAIFIACLGLLGLTMYASERRIKEIGIRKVLGASVQSIVFMLSQNILRLILMSFVLASPLAWYMMNQWLANFAYRIDITGYTFFLAGGLTLLLALFTISFQAIKAGMTNPVESLRYE